MVTEERARIEPTDRSIPPEAMTTAMPRAMRPFSVSRAMMLNRFELVRKSGDNAVKTASSAASSRTRPSTLASGSFMVVSPPPEPEPVAGHGQQDEGPVDELEPHAG